MMRKINQYSCYGDKTQFVAEYFKISYINYKELQHLAICKLVDLGFEMCLHFNDRLNLYECDFYNAKFGHGMDKDKDYGSCVLNAIIEAIYKYKKFKRKKKNESKST